jgi:uncharacterized protein (TIRG00374 family)
MVPLAIIHGLSIIQLAPVKWYVFVSYFDEPPIASLFRFKLVLRFINSVLPTRLSGPSIGPFLLEHFTDLQFSESTAVTGAQVGFYALCYGVWSAIGLSIIATQIEPGVFLLVLLATVAYLIIGMVILSGAWYLEIVPSLSIVKWGVDVIELIPRYGSEIVTKFRELRSISGASAEFRSLATDRKTILVFVMVWVIFIALLSGSRMWVIIDSLGGSGSILFFSFYVITAYSVTILPLTPGGIGVTEATATFVFLSLGYAPEVIVPAIIIDRVLSVYLPALLGWYPSVSVSLSTVVGNSADEEIH